jgi:iron complex transport system substrate-binding protein
MSRSTSRRQFLAASLALGAGTLAACANQAVQPSQITAMPNATPTTSAATKDVNHLIGEVEIPADPQRVVTLHDLGLTTMALHLGFQPIGSHGRIGANGEETFSLGEGFSPEGLTHVGASDAINIERIIALQPDLIIGRSFEEPIYDQLSQVAPTVLVPPEITADAVAYSAYLANLLNRTQRHEELVALYEAKIEQIKFLVPNPEELFVTALIMNSDDGVIQMFGGTLAIDKVFRDVGFNKRAAVREMEEQYVPGGDRYLLSLETIADLDADFVFNNYYGSGSDVSLISSQVVETGSIWQQLHAVQQRQYINSDAGLTYGSGMFYLLNAADLVRTHIGERAFVTNFGGWD